MAARMKRVVPRLLPPQQHGQENEESQAPGQAGFAEDQQVLVQGQVEPGLLAETQEFQGEQEIAGADAADREEADHAPAVAQHIQPAVADPFDGPGEIGGGRDARGLRRANAAAVCRACRRRSAAPAASARRRPRLEPPAESFSKRNRREQRRQDEQERRAAAGDENGGQGDGQEQEIGRQVPPKHGGPRCGPAAPPRASAPLDRQPLHQLQGLVKEHGAGEKTEGVEIGEAAVQLLHSQSPPALRHKTGIDPFLAQGQQEGQGKTDLERDERPPLPASANGETGTPPTAPGKTTPG